MVFNEEALDTAESSVPVSDMFSRAISPLGTICVHLLQKRFQKRKNSVNSTASSNTVVVTPVGNRKKKIRQKLSQSCMACSSHNLRNHTLMNRITHAQEREKITESDGVTGEMVRWAIDRRSCDKSHRVHDGVKVLVAALASIV